MRPATSHCNRSIPATNRSDSLSVRSRSSNANASMRPFTARSSQQSVITGKKVISLPIDDINLVQRPVTAAGGLGGLKRDTSSTFHQKRQVQDASYYISLFQTKGKAITREIEKLNNEIKALQLYDNSTNVEEIYHDLQKEVHDLEGLLADHNLAHDKMRGGYDPEELEASHKEVQTCNKKLESDLDEVFIKKQKRDEDIEKIESYIAQLYNLIEDQFKNVDDSLYNHYKRTINHIRNLQSEGKTIEMELVEMRKKLKNLQHIAFDNDNYKHNRMYTKQKEKLNDLRKSIHALDETLFITQMSPEEAHTYLLKAMKTYQSKLKDLDAEDKRLMKEIEIENSKHNDHNCILEDTAYDIDREWDENNKKDEVNKLIQDQKEKQEQIFSLLDYLNYEGKSNTNVQPTQDGLKQINEDLAFRAKHLAKSEETMKRLIEQKEKRLKEVELVENLEGKILAENQDLKTKIEQMQLEYNKYSNLKHLQEESEFTKAFLIQMKERYIQRRDFMKSKVKAVSAAYEKNKALLDKSATWKSLLGSEEKIRRQGQVIFSIQENIKLKERQTNYKALKNDCIKMMNIVDIKI